eukprot:maker-scaffold715_size107919-snap-gene-0.18 protein:Tk04587 transcript:maker-scaffold715_size107919-snap-gene-0.18-mRNA-1 annotation:"GM23001"
MAARCLAEAATVVPWGKVLKLESNLTPSNSSFLSGNTVTPSTTTWKSSRSIVDPPANIRFKLNQADFELQAPANTMPPSCRNDLLRIKNIVENTSITAGDDKETFNNQVIFCGDLSTDYDFEVNPGYTGMRKVQHVLKMSARRTSSQYVERTPRHSIYSTLVSVGGNEVYSVPVTSLQEPEGCGIQDCLLRERLDTPTTEASSVASPMKTAEGLDGPKPPVWTKGDLQALKRYKKLLGVLVFTLICMCVLLMVLLWQNFSPPEDTSSTPYVSFQPSHEPVRNWSSGVILKDGTNVCLSPECVRASATILNSIDPTIDPCEDFYGYVCNGWMDKHPIPRGRSFWSVTDQKTEDNHEILRSLLERPLDNMASKSEQKSQLLYRSCIDSNGIIEQLGSRPLAKLISSTGGWNLTTPNADSSSFDLRSKLILLQKYSTNALFHWYIKEGMYDTSQYELFVEQGGITLPSKELYKDTKLTEGLADYMFEVVSLLNGQEQDDEGIKRQIFEVINLERQLAQISSSHENRTGVFLELDKADESLSLGAAFGSWKDFFNDLVSFLIPSELGTVFFSGNTRIWIQFDYIKKLSDVLGPNRNPMEQPNGGNQKNILNNYLTWQAIHPYIQYLSKERLSHLTWFDRRTKELILEKISNTQEMMGYPDFIMNSQELDKGYLGFKVSKHQFFENQIRCHVFAVRKNLEMFGTPVDKSAWPLSFLPSTVNAFYLYSRNQILFPAGVLQAPLFSEKQPMALNFGHIGTFMGHELLHGFDDIGRLYGPKGQKLEWWPSKTTSTFEDKTKCFIRQYTQEIFSGWQVDGKRTLSENIADNGGLAVAYQAYKRWINKYPLDQMGLLPGLAFTEDQLIFIGFARAHCSTMKNKAMEIYLQIDHHSPSHVRVNTAVSNLVEFAEAFQCPPESALRLPSEERCSL